jgi:hypothetical protein
MLKLLNINNTSKTIQKFFCTKEKVRKEEILLYIMNDKHSVKPDKEFRISHKTIEKVSEDKKVSKIVLYYDKHSIKQISNLKSFILNASTSFKKKVQTKLFPREYPYSVKPGYYDFSKYLFIFNVLFNAMNFLTTQVLINSLNLNISKSTSFALSAGLNWAIKEGIGQICKR